MTSTLVVRTAFVCAVLAGCSPKQRTPEPPPPPAVTVVKPVMFGVQSYHEYNGYLDSIENVQVRARVKGYLEKVHFVDGTDVTAGKDLYTIDPREYEALEAKAEADIERGKADQANAEAQIKLAEAELSRQTQLGPAASQADKDKAVANLSVAKAQLKTAVANTRAAEAALRTARLELEFTKIKAPISGRINRTLVTQGNLVGQNETTLLTTIVRMDKLHVYFDAPERDLPDFQPISTTSTTKPVTIDIGVTNERGFPHAGTIDFRENRVDTGTGTVRIRGELDNPIGPDGKNRILYPGYYAKVRVPSGPKIDLPVIPEEALMTGQEGRFVYVLDKENKLKKQNVDVVLQAVWRAPPRDAVTKPGWSVGAPTDSKDKDKDPIRIQSIVAIRSGLDPEDRVVIVGLQKALPGQVVAPDIRELIPPSPAK